MSLTIKPQELTHDLTPQVMVDDYVAGTIHIYLSPEISLQNVELSECFKGMNFKKDCRAEWAKELRKIAGSLESC